MRARRSEYSRVKDVLQREKSKKKKGVRSSLYVPGIFVRYYSRYVHHTLSHIHNTPLQYKRYKRFVE